MKKIILSGYIDVPDEDLERVMSALPEHIKLSRLEEGCLIFNVSQRPDCKTQFDVYEEFVHRRAFELHQQRVANSIWGAVTKDVKRFYQVTEIPEKV